MFDPNNISDDFPTEQKQTSYRSSPVVDRYKRSYEAANRMIVSGTITKVLGSILCIGSLSAGILLIGVGGLLGFLQFLGMLEFCLILGVILYSMGLLISGQGHILRISVDGAINTSPTLTPEQKRD